MFRFGMLQTSHSLYSSQFINLLSGFRAHYFMFDESYIIVADHFLSIKLKYRACREYIFAICMAISNA